MDQKYTVYSLMWQKNEGGVELFQNIKPVKMSVKKKRKYKVHYSEKKNSPNLYFKWLRINVKGFQMTAWHVLKQQ